MQPDAIPWTTGNHLQLLVGGQAFFPALIAAIDQAHHSVFLESYIFANDPAGQAVAQALIRAAHRGVQIQILVDGFGAKNFVPDFGQTLRAVGIHYQIYRPETRRWKLQRSRLKRLHRKLCVIDFDRALIGGHNIIDDHNTPAGLAPRLDISIEVSGPAAAQIHRAALREWALVARSGQSASLSTHLQALRHYWTREYRRLHRWVFSMPPVTASGLPQAPLNGTARFLPRDNTLHRRTITRAYLAAIENAQQTVYLAHAYFLPGYRFRHVLFNAAARGVQIHLLLQGSSDHPLLQYATRALYRSLLIAGVHLYEYQGGFLHAKVGVVDSQWATVGSSNMDPFSLSLAHEGNLEIRDCTLAQTLAHELQQRIAEHSEAITLDHLKKTRIYSRLMCWLAYGIVRILITLSGYERDYREQ